MTKIRQLVVAVMGMLLVNFGLLSLLLLIEPGNPPEEAGRRFDEDGQKNVIIEKLAFTPEQVTAYDPLIDGHKAAIQTLTDEARHIRSKLYATLANDTKSGADSLINQLGTLQVNIETVHYSHFAEIKKLCRADQQEKFRDLTNELSGYFRPLKNLPPPQG